jgi:AcrR family transcriptional regulator
MNDLLLKLKIPIHEKLYLTDPLSSKLGKNILVSAIVLIDEIGFEKFTFKKLGVSIDSPEASIYRYFKSKNQLLTYLISWYWGWMEYCLVYELANIESAEYRLEKAIHLITKTSHQQLKVDGIDVSKLHRIVISESSKSFLTKEVDKANDEGAFYNYKQFVVRLASIVKEINPDYKYPNMLLSTIIEGAHLQVFFAEHLPLLTNKQTSANYVSEFYTDLALNSIKQQQ